MIEEERAAEEKAKTDKVKADAEEAEKVKGDAASKMDAKLDAYMSAMDSMAKRFDAYDEEKKADKAKRDAEEAARDPEEAKKLAADKAKKDADEKAEKEKEEAEKADAARKVSDAKRDEEVQALKDAMKPRTDSEAEEMADAHAKADSVASAFGERAASPIPGETPLAYRRRLLGKIKDHSADWKDADLSKLDSVSFAVAEKNIYAAAMIAANAPVTDLSHGLREIVRTDEAGRRIKEFRGAPRMWMDDFKGPIRAARVLKPEQQRVN